MFRMSHIYREITRLQSVPLSNYTTMHLLLYNESCIGEILEIANNKQI